MLAYDMDEARFITHRVAIKATRVGLTDVARASDRLAAALGPVGTPVKTGYATQLLALADAIRHAEDLPPLGGKGRRT